MSQRQSMSTTTALTPLPIHLGAFLQMLRVRHGIAQGEIVRHLPGWSQSASSKVEKDARAPLFDQLVPIYHALAQAGVQLTVQDRQQFILLARRKIEGRKTRHQRRTEADWEELRFALASIDHLPTPPSRQERGIVRPPTYPVVESRHLIGREAWLVGLLMLIQGELPKKLLVLQGPVGIGKSSELHRLAHHLLTLAPSPHVVFCILPDADHHCESEEALDMLLGALLAEIGPPNAVSQTASVDARMTFVLDCLTRLARPVVILLDNAEHLLDAGGQLAPCWHTFLKRFLRSQHRASLVMATREWPGWYTGEQVFVAEQIIPALTMDEGVALLQRLGLTAVPTEYLQHASDLVGGIPLCLEWLAILTTKPLLDTWDALDDLGDVEEDETADLLTRRFLRLLDDRTFFDGDIANRLTPMVERIMAQRLSPEVLEVLYTLSLAHIPLGKPALQQICPRPGLLKVLRSVSLLTAHQQRIQVLPMVASVVSSRLLPEQRRLREEQLIEAYRCWLDDGTMYEHEAGAIIAELTMLCLKHHRLVEAAEHLIYYGWLGFNQGHGPRLARLAEQAIQQCDWQATLETSCAVLLLQEMLSPFLGKTTDAIWQVQEERIRNAFLTRAIRLPPGAEHYLTHLLMLHAMNEARFEEAQAIVEAYAAYLELRHIPHLNRHSSLLSERAFLFGTWCEYLEEQGEKQKARELREQAIALYRHYSIVLQQSERTQSPLTGSLHKRAIAYCLNHLGYALGRQGNYEEALEVIDRSIALKEQGYTYIGGLAAAYGDKSQILLELGRFQEALVFADRASADIRRSADTGDAMSQQEVWIHQVNRGQLYLRLGRVEEAEQVLREARLHIRPERSVYRMFAQQALDEIEQWRQQATSPDYQLDWRWIGRYRELVAYDGHGWLAAAGPFTDQEQQQWDQLVRLQAAAVSSQLATLIVRSRERELQAAIVEHREPRLWYPAIEIEDVRRRIAGLLQLDAAIEQNEPNVLVRRLYHGAIEDEVDFLRLIEATYERDTETYWACNLRLSALPTSEEVAYALLPIKRLVVRGLERPETRAIAEQVGAWMQNRLHLSLDLPPEAAEDQGRLPNEQADALHPMVNVQAVKKFFQAALREGGCDDWKVEIDPKSPEPRVEGGLRTLFLPDRLCRLDEVRYWFVHELVGHIGRNRAGERSRLGLLGIGTKHYQPTEEGFNAYHERQIAALHGESVQEPEIWMGTITTGLASGVITPPQTFQALRSFLEGFGLLYQVSRYGEIDMPKAQEQMRQYALHLCLRVFRGVPDLERAGVCYLQDAMYLRGLRMIEQAVAENPMVLDRLAVGKVALEVLPDLEELGIVSTPEPLRRLAYDPDLDAHILSFEQAEQQING